jgi:hypothetical protein
MNRLSDSDRATLMGETLSQVYKLVAHESLIISMATTNPRIDGPDDAERQYAHGAMTMQRRWRRQAAVRDPKRLSDCLPGRNRHQDNTPSRVLFLARRGRSYLGVAPASQVQIGGKKPPTVDSVDGRVS